MKKSFLAKILSIGLGVNTLFRGHQIKATENTDQQTVRGIDQIINEIKNNYNEDAHQLLDCWNKFARLNTRKEEETEISSKSHWLALGLAVIDFFTLGIFSFSYLYQGKLKKASPLPPVFGWYRSLYNFTHLLPGTQTDCDGKLIKNW